MVHERGERLGQVPLDGGFGFVQNLVRHLVDGLVGHLVGLAAQRIREGKVGIAVEHHFELGRQKTDRFGALLTDEEVVQAHEHFDVG